MQHVDLKTSNKIETNRPYTEINGGNTNSVLNFTVLVMVIF
jgi:hypothetical protein